MKRTTKPVPVFIMRDGQRVELTPTPVSVYKAPDVGRHLRAAKRAPTAPEQAATDATRAALTILFPRKETK